MSSLGKDNADILNITKLYPWVLQLTIAYLRQL